MLSLRNLNIVTAACAVLGVLVLLLTHYGPVTDNGIPQHLLLILMFAEFVALAGLMGAVMAVKQIKLNGINLPVALSGLSCLLFSLAFGAFGIYIWRTYIGA
ncbi:MAG: hypothetical protein JKY90_04695 [Gammaproteobacteria bacterium]|nr:hypothetical protein [Gammaproteobacteria bacterium]